MIQQLQMFRTFCIALNAKRKSEVGASAVEYGLMVAAIAAIIVVGVFALGKIVDGAFTGTETAIENKGVTPAPAGG